MARISFTSSTEEIIGKYGGNVFQDGYFGMQLRGLTKPHNPQTELQQLRRGDFRFLSSSWRNLSAPDKATWISAAGTTPEALRLFIGSNVNLIIAEQPSITAYSTGTTPPAMPLQINALTPIEFTLQAASTPTVVPTGNTLLIYATDDAKQTDTYINPSQYQPVRTFAEGTDMATERDIVLQWYQHYGIMHLSRRICIKSVLIDNTNGQRGPERYICATVTLHSSDALINFDGYYIIQAAGGFKILYA